MLRTHKMYPTKFHLFLMILGIPKCFGRPNFLLIMLDDLRPTLGCYGDVNSWTPNIDKLAQKGLLFTRAYAQQSLCAPSRNSMLTSRRPDSLLLYDFYSYWRNTIGNFTTLPQHLKESGYITKSVGKIFHPGISSNNSDDSPYSWNRKPFHPFTNRLKNAPVCPDHTKNSTSKNLVCPVSVESMPMKTLPDIENLEVAKDFLNHYRIQNSSEPFFLAVGFEKPHIPLKYPQKFLKNHPIGKFKLKDYQWPRNLRNVSYNPWTDLRERDDVKVLSLKFPWEKIPELFARKIVQSYYAAVTYVDDLVGQLLEKLRDSGFEEDTIVILTSDHGWSLGEHAEWGKYSNFEVALRVPLIVSWPSEINVEKNPLGNITREKISETNSIVELVDLFPTIAELAGNPIPICSEAKTNLCSEGISFLPILKSSSNSEKIRWKRAAFSQYPRPGLEPTLRPNSDKPRLREIKIMGYTVRTKRYRYTAWIKFEDEKPDWRTLYFDELYDHRLDPGEMSNRSEDEKFSDIKRKLKKLVKAGWRRALPDMKNDEKVYK